MVYCTKIVPYKGEYALRETGEEYYRGSFVKKKVNRYFRDWNNKVLTFISKGDAALFAVARNRIL